MPRPGGTRKNLAAARAAAEGTDRYIDLCLVLRRLTVDLPEEVPEKWTLRCGDVELVTAAAGRAGVPVRSAQLGASAVLQDGAALEGGGQLRAETVLRAGGRWDTLQERYDGEAAAPRVFDLVEAQVEPARFVAGWIERYRARQTTGKRAKDIRTLLHYGNRGGGKTVLGLWCTVAVCLAVPGTVAWAISRSRTQSADEIHDALVGFLPKAWYAYQGQPRYRFQLVNKSKIREMTADDPADLKQGRVDWAFLNEAAKMPDLAYGYPIGRISDRGGLCYIATNPPTVDVPRGTWVWHFFRKNLEREATGKRKLVEIIQTDAATNAAIDQDAREDVGEILAMVNPLLAAADADGKMQGASPQIIYAFKTEKHGLRAPPQLGDITAEFLRRHPRVRRAFPYLAGIDFQASFPYITATFFKIFGSYERPILWAVSGMNPEGNEDDFLDTLSIEGIPLGEGEAPEAVEPSTVLWIGDSSAQFQNSKHEHKAPPSFPAFLNRGYKIMSPTLPVTPGALYGRNPPIGSSFGQVNRWFSEDRIMISPMAKGLLTDCRDGIAKEYRGGLTVDKPHSHFLDGLRYVLWFLSPPMKRVRPAGEERRGPGVTVLPGR